MKRLAYSIFLLAVLPLAAIAQQQSYTFTATSGTYTELSNATVVDSAAFNQLGLYLLNLQGETFEFYDMPFSIGGLKTIHIGQDGFMRVDNDSTLIIMDGLFTYIDSIDQASSVSYVIEGSAGSRVIKTQWKNQRVRSGQAGNYVNFQIWIYQATGEIEIHYGPRSVNNASGFNLVNGPNIGMFFARDDFSQLYEKLWIHGTPDSIIVDTSMNFKFYAMKGVPEEGTVLRFTPRFALPTSIKTTSAIEQPQFYPNPVSRELNIKNITAESCVAIYDINGALIREVAQASTELRLDLSALAEGVYMIRVADERGVYSEKLLKLP